MTASAGRQGFVLSHEERWLLHHLLVDRLELAARSPDADRPPADVYRLFEKLEAGSHRFTPAERRRLRTELARYAEARDTPERDRPVARRLEARFRRKSSREAPRSGP